jgi:hypothetical protein
MTEFDTRGSRLRMARSRGAASGFLLVLLGIWGALIPFIGPYVGARLAGGASWRSHGAGRSAPSRFG